VTRAAPVAASALPASAFRYRRRIRFGECDLAGIVYYPRFVELVHDTIEAWVSAPSVEAGLGLDYHAMIRAGTGFPTARLEVEFLAPATMGDDLSLVPLVGRIGSSSVELVVHAHRSEAEIFRSRLVVVTVSIGQTTPVRLPGAFRAALERSPRALP